MKERPITFTVDLIPRILDGSKIHTRRIIKKPTWSPMPLAMFNDGLELVRKGLVDFDPASCPYGQPGDHLWVREPLHI
jgi:hypothetical protein